MIDLGLHAEAQATIHTSGFIEHACSPLSRPRDAGRRARSAAHALLLTSVLAGYSCVSAKELLVLTPPSPDEATRIFISTLTDAPELSNAELTLKALPYAAVGSASAALDAVKAGKIALALVPAAALPGFPNDGSLVYTSLLSQPAIIRDAGEQFFIQDSVIGDLVAEEVGRKGFAVVSFWNQSAISLVTRRMLTTASDFKGLKIRAPGPQSSAVLASLGANPVNLQVSETYAALERGMVDGSESRVERDQAALLVPLKGGSLVAGFQHQQGFLLAGEQTWVQLKERERAAIRAAASQATSRARSTVVAIEASLPEEARKNGLMYATFPGVAGTDAAQNAATLWLRGAGQSGTQAMRLLTQVKQGRPPPPKPRGTARPDQTSPTPIFFASVRNDEGGTDLSNRFGIARDVSAKLTCGEVKYGSDSSRPFGEPYAGRIDLVDPNLKVDARPCVGLFAAAAKRSGGALVLFIHGYNNTFDNAIRKAIGVGQDLQIRAPIVVWTWPSQGTKSGYVYDTQSVEFSRPYFREFAAALIPNASVKQISVVAHSMGSRIGLQMLEQSAQTRKKLASIAFVAADVPQTLFAQALARYGGGASLATLYANEHDGPLKISEVVNREPPAGLAGNTLFVRKEIETVDMSKLDFAYLGSNHSVGFDIPKAAADVSMVVTRYMGAASRSLSHAKLGDMTYWLIEP